MGEFYSIKFSLVWEKFWNFDNMKFGTDFGLKFNGHFYSIKFGKDLCNSFNCVFFTEKFGQNIAFCYLGIFTIRILVRFFMEILAV